MLVDPETGMILTVKPMEQPESNLIKLATLD